MEELLGAFESTGKFNVRLSPATHRFFDYLDTYGRFRYYETPYYTMGDEVFRLDRAVWELRRYARVLDYELTDSNGRKMQFLDIELKRNEMAEQRPPHEFSIRGGSLEKIISKRDHPSRPALIWNNMYFCRSRRKSVRYKRTSESGNSPLSLHPEILDEVLKYVFLPKDVVKAYRDTV